MMSALALAPAAHATSEVPFAMSLRGVRSVYLSVNNSSGWSEVAEALSVITPELESKLRSAGLQVLTEDQWHANPDSPVLDVIVRAAKTDGSLGRLRLSGGPDHELDGTGIPGVRSGSLNIS